MSRIKSDITLVLNQLSATKNNLALEEENKVLAEENLEIALEKFKLGSSTILELNDAQQRYDNAINRFVNATYAVYFAELQAKQIINIQ
ncbi:MAG: TolC family protein [Saprospiraceae bacterium]|nr:TolC family protein [Saprospiraceae bacterium]